MTLRGDDETQTDPPRRDLQCPQCGNAYLDRACGPTHAVFGAECKVAQYLYHYAVGAITEKEVLRAELSAVRQQRDNALTENTELRTQRDALLEEDYEWDVCDNCGEGRIIVWLGDGGSQECIKCNTTEREAIWARAVAAEEALAKQQAMCVRVHQLLTAMTVSKYRDNADWLFANVRGALRALGAVMGTGDDDA